MSFKNGLELIQPGSIEFVGTSAVYSLGSVSFSAVTSLTLNNVFSSEYDNYMIVSRVTNDASNRSILLRLKNVTPDGGSNYTWQRLYVDAASIIASRTVGTTSMEIGASYATLRAGYICYVYAPSLSRTTAFRSVMALDYLSGMPEHNAGVHLQQIAYTSMTVFPSGGNMTGRIAVYGMRK